ncbi:winged helix-turn-helix domain-containing protein [Nonomuraea polychroma]|uniref:winged helix-turn-helix domain-containing protein n=1 Tax=Nonomuraea polychroma TaxID=46176 RepID=UPI003D9171BF
MADTAEAAAPALLRIDVRAHEAWCGDRPLTLNRMQFRVLVELARNEGAVVTHEQFLANVWGDRHYGQSKTLVTHIAQLRRLLGDDGSLIRTVTNVGYKLAPGSLAHPIADPLPSGDRQQALDLAQVLHDSIVGLRAYIDARAAELAAPRIATIRRHAEQRVAELEDALAAERQRREDLGTEMRRQVRALKQQLARARASSGRPEGVAG